MYKVFIIFESQGAVAQSRFRIDFSKKNRFAESRIRRSLRAKADGPPSFFELRRVLDLTSDFF